MHPSCYVTANVTHSSYEKALLWKYKYIVPMQPMVKSLTQYTGSSLGGDSLAASILDLPPVADGDSTKITIQFGATFVEASAVYNNADGSLSISFRTPPLTTGAGSIVTVQFTRGDTPQLSARVEFQYYDATAVRLLRIPSPRVGSNQGGTKSDMSFANFAVLSDLELALNLVAIFGF